MIIETHRRNIISFIRIIYRKRVETFDINPTCDWPGSRSILTARPKGWTVKEVQAGLFRERSSDHKTAFSIVNHLSSDTNYISDY
jgi:hypothetical protein